MAHLWEEGILDQGEALPLAPGRNYRRVPIDGKTSSKLAYVL